MKHRTGEPWMSAVEYGLSLEGLSLNLLVRQIGGALEFARVVLSADVVYADSDFAVVRVGTSEFMIHADHAYSGHPLGAMVPSGDARGAGIELRVHQRDPDAAEIAARTAGYHVLASAADKPHGLREVYILDPDGYCWVLDRPIVARD
jgi:uncharacterized glyoxalase superfamily protein PhnB